MIEKLLAVILGVLILVSIAIPLTNDMVSDSAAAVSSVSDEQFNGTSGVAYTPTEYLHSVTAFYLQTITVKHNATAIGAINATRTLTLSTPIGQGNSNLTITHNATADVVNVSIGTHNLGVLTAAASDTFTVPTSYLSATTTVNVTYYDNSTRMNITNISLSEPYWATSTAYSVVDGELVPDTSGNFLMSYDYAIPTTGITMLALSVLPALLGVLALVFVSQALV